MNLLVFYLENLLNKNKIFFSYLIKIYVCMNEFNIISMYD